MCLLGFTVAEDDEVADELIDITTSGCRVDLVAWSGISGIVSKGGIGGPGDCIRGVMDSADSDGSGVWDLSERDRYRKAVEVGEGGISFGSTAMVGSS